jgi:hypothetical protein
MKIFSAACSIAIRAFTPSTTFDLYSESIIGLVATSHVVGTIRYEYVQKCVGVPVVSSEEPAHTSC